MKKQTIWKSLFVLSGISFILLSILAFHVYEVTKPPSGNFQKQTQLSRIDFDCSLTDPMVSKVKRTIKNQEGVHHVYCNSQDGIAVFSHTDLFTKSEQLLTSLKQNGFDRVHRYAPDVDTKTGNCPMILKESWLVRWGEKIHNLFSYI